MNKRFTKLFLKFLMPYVLIVLIMIGMSSVAYFSAFRVIKDNAIRMQQSYIDQSKSVLDRRFTEAIDASLQLQQLPAVNAFKERTAEDLEKNYFPAASLHHQLKDIRFVNEIIVGYNIFFKNSGIAANNAYLNYYNNISTDTWSVIDMSREAFWEGLFTDYHVSQIEPVMSYNFQSRVIDAIAVSTTVGYNFENPEAVVYMLMDANKLRENMTGFESNVGGNFFIASGDGRILTSLHKDDAITANGYLLMDKINANYITFEAPSDVTDWRYILVQPAGEVYRELNVFRSAATILISMIFAVGLIVSYFSARYSSKPVQKLMNSHEQLTERVKNQIPFLRMNFLERWLKGSYTNIDELIAVTKYMKASYIGTMYCVMVIDYDEKIDILEDDNGKNLETLQMKQLIVKDLLTEDVLQPEYIHVIDHDKLAVIFITDGWDEKQFKDHIRIQIDLCQQVLADGDVEDFSIGIGSVCKEMAEVTSSLSEALEAVSASGSTEEATIIWYEDLDENVDMYYYPSELEGRLYNCTKAGDSDQVEQILRDIFKRNVFDRTLPPHMMKLFIYDLWGTLAKIQERTTGEADEAKAIIIDALEKSDSMNELEKLQFIKKVYQEVAQVAHMNQEEKHSHIMDNINEYIKANFKDPDFCLPLVAEKFNLSYAYLSQIFKEFNGESFINYLQKLRMGEAEHLLLTTRMPVKDIVAACGYNSSNTFGKAFKRMHGVSASVYREKRNKEAV